VSAVELVCDSGSIAACPDLPLVTYPHKDTTKCEAPAIAQGDPGKGACMLPLVAQTTMPSPCDGAPSNPWCQPAASSVLAADQGLPFTSAARSLGLVPLLALIGGAAGLAARLAWRRRRRRYL
jgi:hypothetical protein